VGETAAVWEALGDLSERIGAYEEAAAAFRTARRQLRGDRLAEARLLLKDNFVAEETGRIVQALRVLTRALRLLEGLDDPAAAAERARLASRYAMGRFRQGRHREAVRWCERAIEDARSSGDKEALAWAYLVLDGISTEYDLDTPDDYGRMALDLYEELGNLPKQATILNNLGAHAYYEGRWQEALELYERSAELFSQTGDTVSYADEMYNIGELLSEQGRLEEAEARLREAARTWRAMGRELTVPYATRELGRVAYRSGRCEEALELLRQARDAFRAAGAGTEVDETDVRIAECLLHAGDGDGALRQLDELLERAGGRREVAGLRTPRLQRIRGYALLQAGRTVEAEQVLAESLRAAREAGAGYEAALALAGLAELARLSGNGHGELAEESAAILARLGVSGPPPLPVLV
jgi:tetratricopeptide (TPR) repeat protein